MNNPTNLFVHRKVASAYFETHSLPHQMDTFPYLFTQKTIQTGRHWSADKFEVGIDRLPSGLTQRKAQDENNPLVDGQKNYSFVIVMDEVLQKRFGDNSLTIITEIGVSDGRGTGTYRPEIHNYNLGEFLNGEPKGEVVGMHFSGEENYKLSNDDRVLLMDHMYILEELPEPSAQHLMSEDNVSQYKCIHLGKTAAKIIQRELQKEGRLPELTEVNMYLMNQDRNDEVLVFNDTRSLQEKK